MMLEGLCSVLLAGLAMAATPPHGNMPPPRPMENVLITEDGTVRLTDEQAREVLGWAEDFVNVCRKLCA